MAESYGGAGTYLGEDFFKQISDYNGKYSTIDEPTRNKDRLDVGRVLVTTTVPYFINKVMEVKVNSATFSIRVMEESSEDKPVSFSIDWRYQSSDGLSSEEDDLLENSLMMVSETVLSTGEGEEDIQRLNREFSNPAFGKAKSDVVRSSPSCNVAREGGAQGMEHSNFTSHPHKTGSPVKGAEEGMSKSHQENRLDGIYQACKTEIVEEVCHKGC